MNVRAYLNQIRKLDKMIQNKLVEIEQWKSIALGSSISSEGDRVQSSGSQDRMADAVIRYVSIQQEIDADIDRLVDAKREVISTIEQLPLNEYDILHQVYIQYKTLDVVADEYQKSYSWATTIHGRALKNLRKILDDRNRKE